MALIEHPLSALRHFLPDEIAFDYILSLIDQQGIELEIKKERKTIYGNFKIEYRPEGRLTKITINGSLPPFQFYFTLLHEIAHYYTTIKYGTRVKPHGKEWKNLFGKYLKRSLELDIFPEALKTQVRQYAENPKASSCSDSSLQIALYQLENKNDVWNLLALSDLSEGTPIESKDGSEYVFIKKLRKNYLLKSPDLKHEYIAPPTLEIKKL